MEGSPQSMIAKGKEAKKSDAATLMRGNLPIFYLYD